MVEGGGGRVREAERTGWDEGVRERRKGAAPPAKRERVAHERKEGVPVFFFITSQGEGRRE